MSTPNIPSRCSRRGVASLAAILAVALVPAFSAPALGRPDPGRPSGEKGQPSLAAPAAPARPECDLNKGDSPNDEFAHCTNVVVEFASSPDVGAITTVDVSVTSVADLASGTLTVLVNDGFAIADADGFAAAGTKPSGVGELTAVSRGISLSADETATFAIKVRGEYAGVGIVQARYRTAGGIFDGGDEASAQFGRAAPLSPLGGATEKVLADATLAPVEPSPAPNATPPSSSQQPATQSQPGAPGASCASGGWRFDDENGASQPSRYFRVQVWDQDAGSNDLLASGFTDSSGNYNLCFESTDADEGGGQEVYVRFVSNAGGAWRVRNTRASNSDYAYVSGVVNYADPGSHDFGNLQPTNGAEHRALHAFDGIARLWLWHYSINSYLDNPGQSRKVVVNWTPTSSDGTYYSRDFKDIHLKAADPDSDHTTIHEGAHALMDAIYNDDFPPAPNCNPHNIFNPSSTGCAWTEGWAEWVPARVLNDPYFRWADGSSLNLETPSWDNYTGAYGDTSEGRIAGALIDLSDSANENYWDRFSEGGSTAASEESYLTMLTGVSDTFNEFFVTDRDNAGYDTGYFARASLFHNTIDYTHRDPLIHDQARTRPSLDAAPDPHNYSYTTTSSYWGGVAIRPPGTADYDLSLYANEAQSSLLTTSSGVGSVIDYVVVDGNHNAGSFFPRALHDSGSGQYGVEQYEGSTTLALGTSSYSIGAGDILRTWDRFAVAGVTYYVRVLPSPGLDVGLYAHDSNGAIGSVQRRTQALAHSAAGGAGAAEQISYNVAATDYTGLVLTNANAGSGYYTLYRDTAGPSSPTVLIDGGNATTYDSTVDLTLSADAANGAGSTPVIEVRISTDGTFDTESWMPIGSATATLPGGTGTKTVTVQYRNAAGAVSAEASDTIQRINPPDCEGQTPTIAGNGTIVGTNGPDVIVGSTGDDLIYGLGGDDTICALGGNDTIYDGPGADIVRGANGNDTFLQPSAVDNGDVLDGGGGLDHVSYASRTNGVNVAIDNNANDGEPGEGDLVSADVENVTGGTGDDTLVGNGGTNRFFGRLGDDLLNGAGGNDTLRGLQGNDRVIGGGGNDTVDGGEDDDIVRGGLGDDTVLGGAGDDIIDEDAENNGKDIIRGNGGWDEVLYTDRSASVTIRLNGQTVSGESGENDRLLGIEEAFGGSGDDFIYGHIFAEILWGLGGHDLIDGQGNADQITGGPGDDTLLGSNGADSLNSQDRVGGNDSVNGGAGVDSATYDPGDTVTNVP